MRRMMAGLLLGMGALLSCRAPTALEDVLAEARDRWARAGIDDYSVTVARSCECTAEMTGPVVVEVVDGSVVARHYVATGAAVASGLAPEFPSVEELFARIEEAAHRPVANLDARYDSQLGYPTRVEIDFVARVVDDEITYTMSDLRPR